MTRAVLFDMFDTLVELQPPAPRLRALLHERTGVDVGDEAAARGMAAEIDHYLANHMRGRDQVTLDALRDDCASVLHRALGAESLEHSQVRDAMLDSLLFRVFSDVQPALESLRARGMGVAVVSNWDCSLPEWLERAGLSPLCDGVISSAVVGAPKPSPAPFLAALDLLGVQPGQALHVGDSICNDVGGARAAGVRPVLIARDGAAPEGIETIHSLAELLSLT